MTTRSNTATVTNRSDFVLFSGQSGAMLDSFCIKVGWSTNNKKSRREWKSCGKSLARATGLEPVTYGLTANCTIFSKTAEIRRKLGVFVSGDIGCVLFLCVSVCFCSKFLKQPKAIKNNYK